MLLIARFLECAAVALLFVVHRNEPLFAVVAAVLVGGIYGLVNNRMSSDTRRVTAQMLMVAGSLLILTRWLTAGAALILIPGSRLLMDCAGLDGERRLLSFHSLYWGIILLLVTPTDSLGWVPSVVGMSYLVSLVGYKPPRCLRFDVNALPLWSIAMLLGGVLAFVCWRLQPLFGR